MPAININGNDVEFSTWREIPVEEGVDVQRAINGDANVTVLFDKKEWEGRSGPLFSRAELDAYIAQFDSPNEVPMYGDLPGGTSGAPLTVVAFPRAREFTHTVAGFYAQVDVRVVEV